MADETSPAPGVSLVPCRRTHPFTRNSRERTLKRVTRGLCAGQGADSEAGAAAVMNLQHLAVISHTPPAAIGHVSKGARDLSRAPNIRLETYISINGLPKGAATSLLLRLRIIPHFPQRPTSPLRHQSAKQMVPPICTNKPSDIRSYPEKQVVITIHLQNIKSTKMNEMMMKNNDEKYQKGL